MLTIESARELYNATQQDELGRYFAKEIGQDNKYTYTRNGEQICFTCGDVTLGSAHSNCGIINTIPTISEYFAN